MMEFIKVKNGYLIKGSNGRIVSEKEKLQLENNEMVIKDFKSNNCQKETTKKISKNKKKIKQLENKEKKYKITTEDLDINNTGIIIPNGKVVVKEIEETAPEKEDDADDTIEETNTII